MLPGGAVGRRFVTRVAAPAHAPLEEHFALSDFGEVEEDFLLVFRKHLRSDRNFHNQIGGTGTGLVPALSVGASLRLEVLSVPEIDEGVETLNRLEHDVAAPAAVPSVRTAILDVFLAPERHGTGAARAGFEEDLGLVEEMHDRDVRLRGLSRYPCANLVEPSGIEPLTSSLRTTRSPN